MPGNLALPGVPDPNCPPQGPEIPNARRAHPSSSKLGHGFPCWPGSRKGDTPLEILEFENFLIKKYTKTHPGAGKRACSYRHYVSLHGEFLFLGLILSLYLHPRCGQRDRQTGPRWRRGALAGGPEECAGPVLWSLLRQDLAHSIPPHWCLQSSTAPWLKLAVFSFLLCK